MAWESKRDLLLRALASAPRLQKNPQATCPELPASSPSPCRYSWQAYVARNAAYSTPEEAEKRLRNPSPQRRKLLQVLVADEKQHAKLGQQAQRGEAAAPAAAAGGGGGGAG